MTCASTRIINSEQKNRNFVVPGSQRIELYDLSHDPFEEFDRAADKPGLVERLGAELMRWEEEGDTQRSPTRVYERRRRTARRPWHSPW